ncbi:MFS transporter [Oceanobacillus sp. J11TS1]|uniref:MFS transporter n=1 Tax=Oceanobacillus sp. J11TS1 TaxID=2807191 RepID=UPI001AFCEB5F|nr:MFS transporter [Oceanobacillus sp. J11TS1]GIO21487.1 MFS transporter [Oceanobacillus sp. J11TS1]
MRTVQTTQVLGNSKFNKFHLLIFLWCFFAIAFDGFDVAIYGIGLPLMMEDFGISRVEAGAISSYTLVSTMVGTFLLGSISDLIGRKKAIAICLALFSIFTFLAGFTQNATLFMVMRVIAALGLGGIMPILVAMMGEYSPVKKRALTIATMYCGYSIGAIIASLIGMFLMEMLGWRLLYWISIIPLLALPWFLKQFPESVSYYLLRKKGDKIAEILNKVDPDGNYQGTDNFEYDTFTEGTKESPIKKVFSNKRTSSTLAFWIAVTCSMLVISGLTTWLPQIMVDSGHGLTSSLSFNLMLAVGQISGSIFGGILVGRLGHRFVLIAMFFTGALCFVLLSVTTNSLLLYFIITLTGACTVGTQNLVNPYISEFYPREIRTTGLSIAVGVGRIGGIMAPVAIALLLTSNLDPQHAFMAFAIPSLLGAISFITVREKHASFDQVVSVKKPKIA